LRRRRDDEESHAGAEHRYLKKPAPLGLGEVHPAPNRRFRIDT